MKRAFLFVLAALLVAHPSRADDPAQQKKHADELMDTYKYTEALELYGQAYAVTKDPALLYNMGRAYEALGQYPQAFEKLEQFDKDASPELRAKVPGLAQRIADVRAKVSTLVLTSHVSGARVVLSNRVLGTTPLSGPIKVNAGHATLEVLAEGYVPFRREIDLAGGGSVTVTANLVSKDQGAVLVVHSPTIGAHVDVDGKPAGTVPVDVVVSSGKHAIVVTKDGYQTNETSAVITPGERKTLTIELEGIAPVTQKWWFWTGIGVVVVAGAVTTIALLTEKPADKGSYPPGQVAGPLVRF